MTKRLQKILMSWPGIERWLCLGLVLGVATLGLATFWHHSHFPPAPPGDGLHYLAVAFSEAVGFLFFQSTSNPLTWGEAAAIRLLQASVLFCLFLGPVVALSRLRLSFALARRRADHLIVGDGGLADQVAATHSAMETSTLRLSPSGRLSIDTHGVVGPLAEFTSENPSAITTLVDSDDLLNFRLATSSQLPNIRHIQISHPALRRRLSTEIEGRQRRPVLFGQADLLARMSLRLHPPNWIVQDVPMQLVILGWGSGAAALLLALLRNCHFCSMSRPSIRVLMRQPDIARAEHCAEQAALDERYPTRFEACDTSEPGSLLNALERDVAPSMVYVCHADSTDLLSAVDALQECQKADYCLAVPVQVMTAGHPMKLVRQVRELTAPSPWFRVNALEMSTVGGELKMQTMLDRLAVQIHENYYAERIASGERHGSRPSVVPWSELSERFREENRAQADHHWIKLRDFGLEAVPVDQSNQEEPASLRILPEDVVESLAIAEHERWVCSRLSFGWRFSENRDDQRLLHPDLVDWDSLDENTRDYDRQAIRALPEVFRSVGMALRRLRLSPETDTNQGRISLAADAYPNSPSPQVSFLEFEALPEGHGDPFNSYLLVRAKGSRARKLLDKRLIESSPDTDGPMS